MTAKKKKKMEKKELLSREVVAMANKWLVGWLVGIIMRASKRAHRSTESCNAKRRGLIIWIYKLMIIDVGIGRYYFNHNYITHTHTNRSAFGK